MEYLANIFMEVLFFVHIYAYATSAKFTIAKGN